MRTRRICLSSEGDELVRHARGIIKSLRARFRSKQARGELDELSQVLTRLGKMKKDGSQAIRSFSLRTFSEILLLIVKIFKNLFS